MFETEASPPEVTAAASADADDAEASDDDDDDDDDDDEDGVEPEIPDRQMMKKLHGMMLDKANAKGKRKKKKFVESPGGEGGKPKPGGQLVLGTRSTAGRRDME